MTSKAKSYDLKLINLAKMKQGQVTYNLAKEITLSFKAGDNHLQYEVPRLV